MVCSNNLGLNFLVNKVLSARVSQEDIHYWDAGLLTKEKARQLEREARLAPRGNSDYTYVYVHNLHNIPTGSAQPLLKVTEEAKYTRFIFQAQHLPRKVHTLMSRSVMIQLPFMSKAATLANIKAMNYDAKSVDQLNLYDGTLQGTINALQMKDALIGIRRELNRGPRGLAALMAPEIVGSLAFNPATEDYFSAKEKEFLRREDTPDRRRLILFLSTERNKE